jgi:hypothetical protein
VAFHSLDLGRPSFLKDHPDDYFPNLLGSALAGPGARVAIALVESECMTICL